MGETDTTKFDVHWLAEARRQARDGDEDAQWCLQSRLLNLQSMLDEALRDSGITTPELTRFHRALVDKAAAWLDARLAMDHLLLDVRKAAHASWWISQYDQNPEGRLLPCAAIRVYVQASVDAVGGGDAVNRYMSERVLCMVCRQHYRMENIGVCVLCGEYYCYRCIDHRWQFRICTCGGEVLH